MGNGLGSTPKKILSRKEPRPMRCRARGLAMIAALLISLVSGVAAAQDKPAEKPAEKPLLIAESLQLTEKESQAFWPVYNAYQSDMIAHYDRIFKLLDDYAGAY